MRTKSLIMVAAVLLTAAGARAQDTNGQTATGQRDVPAATAPTGTEFAPSNEVQVGIRGTSFDSGSDHARFQRYQDLRDGGTLDKFRYAKETNDYGVKLQADHVGYRDQRFFGSYNNFGNLKATFEWNETPLFYSNSVQTLYNQASPGVLVVPNYVQSGIQNGTLTLQKALSGADAFDLQSLRKVADFKLLYSASQNVDLNVTVKNTLRDGSQPMTASFGFSGVPDELAAPIDTRTTDFGTSLQYGNDQAYLKVGYDGSFFRNSIPTLTWSNPFRLTDSAVTNGSSAPANGRLALWPNTDQNTVSVSGGVNKLPGHSHLSALVSYGAQSNNDPLIPFTINSAFTSPALPRTTADVQARVTAMNFVFTSRPANALWFSARYRQYQFDNQTAPFIAQSMVSYDYSLSTTPIETDALGYTRHTFDADASYSPVSFIGLRAGYTREVIDRTFRWIDTTTEDIGRASIDVTGTTWLSVRGVYEHGQRRGSAINAEDILAEGEHPTLSQFDIANRDRDRATGIVTVTPFSMLSFNASAGWLKDKYPGYQFGLLNNENEIYGGGFDAVPIENKLTFGANYHYEKNISLQGSRYAPHVNSGPNPNFFDPSGDWTDNAADKTHNVNVSADVLKILPKTDLKIAYDYNRAESRYDYTILAGAPIINYTTGKVGQPLPSALPAVTNEFQTGIVDLLYHLSAHLGAGVTYAYDKYSVNDFALGPQANGLVPSPSTVATPSIMMLGYYTTPYTANTFWGRLTYRW